MVVFKETEQPLVEGTDLNLRGNSIEPDQTIARVGLQSSQAEEISLIVGQILGEREEEVDIGGKCDSGEGCCLYCVDYNSDRRDRGKPASSPYLLPDLTKDMFLLVGSNMDNKTKPQFHQRPFSEWGLKMFDTSSCSSYDNLIYSIMLPDGRQSTLIDCLRQLISTAKREEGRKVAVCDVGYGSGAALLELLLNPEFAERLELYGLGFSNMARTTPLLQICHSLFSDSIIASEFGGSIRSVYDYLKAQGVRFLEGSLPLINLDELPRQDLITCFQVFQYIDFPHWPLAVQLAKRLRPGGSLHIFPFGLYYDTSCNDIRHDPYMLERSDPYSSFYRFTSPWQDYIERLKQEEWFVALNPEAGLSIHRQGDKPFPIFKGKFLPPEDKFIHS